MKTNQFLSAVAIMLLGSATLFAQRGPMVHKENSVKFTEDQKAKIKEIRMASYKEMKALNNQMGELKAKQRTLVTADKPDMNAINGNIDEITKVQNKMMKLKASNQQQIRALLTDEQKMQYDAKKERGWQRGSKMYMHKSGHQGSGEDLHQGPPQHI